MCPVFLDHLNIHPSPVGYDSLARYIFDQAKLPSLTKLVVYSENSPSNPITNFSSLDSISVNGYDYKLNQSIDTLALNGIYSDSLSVKILAKQGSGAYTGFNHFIWITDNGETFSLPRKKYLTGTIVKDSLLPEIILDRSNLSNSVLFNTPLQRNYPSFFGDQYYSADNVALGLSPSSHVGRGGFVIELPDAVDSWFGIVEIDFSGANHSASAENSKLTISYNNHAYTTIWEGNFNFNRPFFKTGGLNGKTYIVVGDSTLAWSYVVCRVRSVSWYGGFIVPNLRQTNVSFSTSPRVFANSLIDAFGANTKDFSVRPIFAIQVPVYNRSTQIVNANPANEQMVLIPNEYVGWKIKGVSYRRNTTASNGLTVTVTNTGGTLISSSTFSGGDLYKFGTALYTTQQGDEIRVAVSGATSGSSGSGLVLTIYLEK